MQVARRIQLRRDTAASWGVVNPILASGEPGLETDTGIPRIGDGSTAFTALPPLVTAKLYDAKGDILVGSADNAVVRKPVGADGTVLTADAASAGGVKWNAAAASGFSGCRTTVSGTSMPSADTKIAWTAETFDTDAYHDNATNPTRFTVPAGKAGYYETACTAVIASSGNTVGSRVLSLYKNNAFISQMTQPPSASTPTYLYFCDKILLAVGDYVEFSLFQNSGGPLNLSGSASENFATVQFLGA